MRMRSLLGGASPYAHLSGLVPLRGSRRAEDDKDDKETRRGKRSKAEDDDGDEDEPKGRRSRAEDEDRDDDPKGRRSRAEDEDDDKGARAEDEDDDKGAEEDEDEPKSRRGKRSKSRAEDDEDDKDAEDDDDEEEMSGKSAAARARRRERARCKAIFSHKAAAQNVALAASLAFDTTMTRQEAIAVLKSQEGRGGGRDAHDDRRRRNPDLGPGDDGGGASNAKAAEAGWAKALAKVGVKVD